MVALLCYAAALRIVAENPHWAVVDKPPNVAVNGEGSLGRPAEWRLVHRLDRGTSGLLVLAKHREAARALCDAFRRRRVSKVYVAVSASPPKRKRGSVRGDMARARSGAWKLTRSCSPGRCACTDLRSIGLSPPATEEDPARRLIVAKPLTGRSHQIRCAARSFSAPILGDVRYGGPPADRLYLHAAGLCLRCDHVGDIRVVSKPTEGRFFVSERFDRAWDDLELEALLDQGPSRTCTDHPALSAPS